MGNMDAGVWGSKGSGVQKVRTGVMNRRLTRRVEVILAFGLPVLALLYFAMVYLLRLLRGV
jgi:hypothetical protein